MYHISVSLAFLVVLVTVILRWHRRRHKSKSPPVTLPPSPPKLPLVGHLHLVTDMPHHDFARLARKLGPIFHLQLGRVPTIVISSAQLAREVLKTQDHVFANRPQLISTQYISFGCSDVTFSRYGPYWRQARKICVVELLSAKRVNSFQLIRFEETNRLLNSLSTRSGTEVNMSELLLELANDVLCRVAFGRRFEAKSRLGEVLVESQELFAGFSLGDFYPEWGWVSTVTGYRRRLERNLKDLKEVCDEIIREHVNAKKSFEEEVEKGDFLDVLMRVQKREDLEVPITDDNLKALVLDMFVAGTDTTSATLEWTMTELARHPNVLKKAQEEVRRVAASKETVDETDLQHLHYMKTVVKEAMRLHPPVPLLVPRESMESCVLDGYEIPAKTRVLINSYAIARDPDLWENPLEFNPGRFADVNADVKDQDFRFLPFGGGRRGCPGYAFGLATIEITLARLLFHFNWALPQGVGADDVDLSEIFGLASRKKVPLILVPAANKDDVYKRVA